MGAISTYPFYWIGLLAGVLPILLKAERKEFQKRFSEFRRKSWVIVATEVLATIAFACQLGGFTGGHVGVIALLTGSFPLAVFFGGILLVRWKLANEEMFPPATDPLRRAILLCALVIGIAIATI
jgi:multisubunit Na+/H+ antiporter MnhC subunit